MSSNTNLRPDFPDAPEQSAADTPQDKPDLDGFAKRMGTDTIETGDGLDAVPGDRISDSSGIDSRLVIAGGGALVAAILLIVFRRRKKRSLLSKAVALGAAAHVIRN